MKTKIVWKDGANTKAITGFVVKEDDSFVYVNSSKDGLTYRINKREIVMQRMNEVLENESNKVR